jgi:uncharacterized repeat protein (TIGR01451 family)/CSLREA domain-containing protein
LRSIASAALVAVIVSLLAPVPARADATFTVTSSSDAGDGDLRNGACTTAEIGGGCTLRAAIQQANATSGHDTITFNIPVPRNSVGVRLTPTSPYPEITERLTIDGTTQLFDELPAIVVDGSATPAQTSGFVVGGDASSTAIKGLSIGNFPSAGIYVWGDNFSVLDSGIGTALHHNVSLGGNGGSGVSIASSATAATVGNLDGGGNLIAGNGGPGVGTSSGPSPSILGNKIGSDAAGSPKPNAGHGVTSSSSDISIRNNEIDDGPGHGISIWPSGSSINLSVRNNVVRGNNGWGVVISSSSTASTGNFSVLDNVVLSNSWGGISVPPRSLVFDNHVGVTRTGIPGGNDGPGIQIDGGHYANSNTVAYNSGPGIALLGSGPTEVKSNSTYSNGGLGIDRGSNGVSPNTGGGLRNFPELTSASAPVAGSAEVSGFLLAAPSTSYSIQLFVNDTCDSSGHGEGETPLPPLNATTNAQGLYEFVTSVPAGVGDYITATATSGSGGTSEFSSCLPIQGADLSISQTDHPDPVIENGSLRYTITVANEGERTASDVTLADNLPAATVYADAASSQGSCVFLSGDVVCDLNNIDAGEEVTVLIDVTPLAAGPISNLVEVSTATGERSSTNNSHVETTVVKEPNVAPVLEQIGNRATAEGRGLAFDLGASDGNPGDALTYSMAPTPPGATLDPETGAFSWTPSYTQADTWGPITFSVSDGTTSDSEAIYITVTNAKQPVSLTAVADKSKTEVAVTGSSTPSLKGEEVTVKLFREKDGKFVKIDSRVTTFKQKSAYAVSFERPRSGACKVAASYAGDAEHKKAAATDFFKC